MGWLMEFFRTNEVIIFSIYGQVFFIMGAVIAVHSMQHSRLYMARFLWLLAGFGLIHGLVEWGHVFIPIQASYMPSALVRILYVVQSLLLVLSFVCLLVFGAALAFRQERNHRVLASGLPLVVWALALMASIRADEYDFLLAVEIWTRYVLATPACVLAGLGLLQEATQVQVLGLPRIARYLRTAAGAVLVYGAFTGLVTPAYDSLLLSRWINKDVIFQVIGVPIPVIRSLAAVVMAYGIIRSLDVFRMETDRLLQEARDQKLLVAQQELAALSAVGVAVGQSRDLSTVLENGLRHVLALLRLDRGAVLLTEGQPPVVASVQCTCTCRTPESSPECRCCRELAMEMIVTGEPVRLCNIDGNAQGLGITLVAGGRPLGAMILVSPSPLSLTAEVRELLTSIGTQIGVAVANARLWEEVRKKEAARTHLLQRIITAQEEERKRIARELHDDTGQVLTALVIRLNTAQEARPKSAEWTRQFMAETSERLRQAIQDIRKLIFDLRPTLLDDLGLVPAVSRYLESTSALNGLRMRLRSDGFSSRLPSHLETALYRIIQEGVSNAVKHAAAAAVTVTLALEAGNVVAQVEDDGRGYDVAAPPPPGTGGGFGLMGIRERVALLGGSFETYSRLQGGTRLVARIPWSEEAKDDETGHPAVIGG